MAKHFHRIVLCVDVDTDERLGDTTRYVQEAVFTSACQQYNHSNVTVSVLDADCLVGQPRDLPKVESALPMDYE